MKRAYRLGRHGGSYFNLFMACMVFIIPWVTTGARADGGGGGGSAAANQLNLCSSDNTGSDSQVHVSVFQTNGLCSDSCQGYAYAIVQGKSCWCSNYAPGSKTDVSKCSDECPGYPNDKCGSQQDGLFGYILLATPSGTQGGSSSSSPSSTKTSSSTSSSSTKPNSSKPDTTHYVSLVTITNDAQDKTMTVTHSGTVPPSSSTGGATSSSDGDGSSGGGSSSTSDGGSSTATGGLGALAQENGAAGDGSKNGSDDSFFDNKGKVAGVFSVVGIVAVGMIGAVLFFVLRRNHRVQHQEDGSGTPNSFFDGLFRGDSTGSMKRDQSTATTLAGLGYDEKVGGGGSTTGPNGETIVPITVDQRLDPGQMFMRWDQNDSRRSLQDEHDYSRKVLRVTNPDYAY